MFIGCCVITYNNLYSDKTRGGCFHNTPIDEMLITSAALLCNDKVNLTKINNINH